MRGLVQRGCRGCLSGASGAEKRAWGGKELAEMDELDDTIRRGYVGRTEYGWTAWLLHSRLPEQRYYQPAQPCPSTAQNTSSR